MLNSLILNEDFMKSFCNEGLNVEEVYCSGKEQINAGNFGEKN